MEQEEAKIKIACRHYAAIDCIFVFSYGGVRDRVHGLAMDPAGGLSPRASPGFRKRVIDQFDQLRECTVLPDFEVDAR